MASFIDEGVISSSKYLSLMLSPCFSQFEYLGMTTLSQQRNILMRPRGYNSTVLHCLGLTLR